MLRNLGAIDRMIRALLGVALIMVGIVSGLWWLYIIAAVVLLTSIVGICPLYLPLKIKTFTKKDKEKMGKDCC